MTWMVYGAYGYTGRLVTELAVARGQRPVLAGRADQPLRELAERHGLDHVRVDLHDGAGLADTLSTVELVVHCAGPFSRTAAPMVRACLDTSTHYVDITGEIDVFEAVLARHADAEAAGIALLPGSGMDVVPTDCLARTVAEALPGARLLQIAFLAGTSVSPGTAATAVEQLGAATRARVAGRIAPVPERWLRQDVPFIGGTVRCTALSWGDVATAYHSTGIPNVVTYTKLPSAARLQGLAGPLLRRPAVRERLQRLARSRVRGPEPDARAARRSRFWARATAADGRTASVTATGPDPYDLTADAVLRVVARVLDGQVPPGAHTPSRAHGAAFLGELDGVTVDPVTTVTLR